MRSSIAVRLLIAPAAAALGVAALSCAPPAAGPVASEPTTAEPASAPVASGEGAVPAAPANSAPVAPVAERRDYVVTSPNGDRQDPYYWLRDDKRQDPDVIGYLEAENRYGSSVLSRSGDVQERLYEEIVGRIKQDDSSVPYFDGGYWYYQRFEEGQQYGIVARKKGTLEAEEEVLVDQNQLAKAHDFFKLANWKVSPDGTKLALAIDTVGRRQYDVVFKDLASGQIVPDRLSNVDGSLAWANDNKTLFYVEKDPTTLLGSKVRRHSLGDTGEDPLVYEEADKSFYMGVGRTKSGRYISIGLRSTTASETRLIPANNPGAAPKVFFPRERDHLYSIDHVGQRFVIRSNWKAKNYRVLEATERTMGKRGRWREVVGHSDAAFVASVATYDGFLAIGERSGGLQRVKVLPRNGRRYGKAYYLEAEEPAYTMTPLDLPDASARSVRYSYTSLTTPSSVYELSLDDQEKTLLKQDPVLGEFDVANYATEFVKAEADDGTLVPASVVYRKDTPRDGTAPLLVIGYGSYGFSYPISFSSPRLSLLDRGFVIAIAHVRGGQEMGRKWYDAGRLLTKKNTFTDFIDVTEHLVARGYGARDKVFASGGSAGGLLMGAVVNMRPDLYRGITAAVPFVDVVTTMLDESIPLTTNEFDEWGNPKKAEFYEYMLSYSPYDNVAAQDYPAMLVTTGLWDSQVQYFEPAKWVAKLRATKTDANPLVFVTNMDAGHGGKSGRLRRYRETARDFSFMLQVLDETDARANWPKGR